MYINFLGHLQELEKVTKEIRDKDDAEIHKATFPELNEDYQY